MGVIVDFSVVCNAVAFLFRDPNSCAWDNVRVSLDDNRMTKSLNHVVACTDPNSHWKKASAVVADDRNGNHCLVNNSAAGNSAVDHCRWIFPNKLADRLAWHCHNDPSRNLTADTLMMGSYCGYHNDHIHSHDQMEVYHIAGNRIAMDDIYPVNGIEIN